MRRAGQQGEKSEIWGGEGGQERMIKQILKQLEGKKNSCYVLLRLRWAAQPGWGEEPRLCETPLHYSGSHDGRREAKERHGVFLRPPTSLCWKQFVSSLRDVSSMMLKYL